VAPINVRFGKNGRDADFPQCPLLTDFVEKVGSCAG
jgi:hypothetical protein